MGEQQGTGGLKIIGAGFGRTGTLSLKVALEELGFGPCYHMVEVFKNPTDLRHWVAAIQGETVNWHEIFQGYQATVDWPACSFYKELVEAYPEAKVLLSVRDPEKWYESVSDTIYKMGKVPPEVRRAAMEKIVPQGGGNFSPPDVDMRQMEVVASFIWGKVFQGKFEDRAYAIQIFNQHVEQVKRDVPPEKLLVYDVREGWGPLCTFLGIAIPENPFPVLNSRENFQALNP